MPVLVQEPREAAHEACLIPDTLVEADASGVGSGDLLTTENPAVVQSVPPTRPRPSCV